MPRGPRQGPSFLPSPDGAEKAPLRRRGAHRRAGARRRAAYRAEHHRADRACSTCPTRRIAPEGTWRTGHLVHAPLPDDLVEPGGLSLARGVVPLHPDHARAGISRRLSRREPRLRRLQGQVVRPEAAAAARSAASGRASCSGLRTSKARTIFRAVYGAASKQIGNFDLTLGYGGKRIDGAFGGVRYTDPRLPNWSLVAEYDAYDYKLDHGAALSGAADYKKSPAAGIEYRSQLVGREGSTARTARRGSTPGSRCRSRQSASCRKLDEPPPFTKIVPRPTEKQWTEDREHRARLVRALYEQDFRDIRLAYAERGALGAAGQHPHLVDAARGGARGEDAARLRAARGARDPRHLPRGEAAGRDLRLRRRAAAAALLQRHGLAREARADGVDRLPEAGPQRIRRPRGGADGVRGADPRAAAGAARGRGQHAHAARRGRARRHAAAAPAAQGYFNDPSGALKFDVSAAASYERWFPAQDPAAGRPEG